MEDVGDPNPPRWVVVNLSHDDDPPKFACLAVADVMHCINAPGDLGWVQPVPGSEYMQAFIADFKHLYRTRNEAIDAQILRRTEKANKILHLEITQLEALKSVDGILNASEPANDQTEARPDKDQPQHE